ncbi:MAG TPA: flippase activity-associated protein Agl23 [Pyrinomonadaceae bacterium]|nr:flippase activity-associated protein Agl23 [Pyrinomonadaceae bacterium]
MKAPELETPAVEISQRTWILACAAILLVAAVLRFYDLDLVPLHHDEGVNGNFLVRLVRAGEYRYDPANYHGPSIYYLAAIFPWLLKFLFGPNAQNAYGLTTTAIRFIPALFGLATVGLIFSLRRNLGTVATLTAAALLTISPGAVYLSRYFIHETLFVFFTLGIVVAAIKYFESARPVYLILASASAAMLFASKETAIISAGVLVIALVLTRAYWFVIKPGFNTELNGRKQTSAKAAGSEVEARNFVERAGGPAIVAILAVTAITTFIVIEVLLYSSFFRNYPQGVWDALATFKIWSKTGKEAHVHPFITYVWWLMLQESPLLLLGAIGAILAVLKPMKSFALFVGLWAFGLIAAYSLIAYKTPWLALNFVIPLALCSGVAIQYLYEELASRDVDQRARLAVVIGVLLLVIGPLPGLARGFDKAVSTRHASGLIGALSGLEPHWKTFIPGYQTIDLNFINYDNDDGYYVYVYAHTRRDMLKLVEEVERIAERTHQGSETGITIVSPEYWPLPWYLRDFNRVGYHGRMVVTTEPVVIASQTQLDEVESSLGDRYQRIQSGLNPAGTYALRPGVELLLYTRRELKP